MDFVGDYSCADKPNNAQPSRPSRGEGLVHYSVSTSGVARVEMNHAERRNALGLDLSCALLQSYEEAIADPSVRVILLQGRGKTFCSGADLNWMYSVLDSNADAWMQGYDALERLAVAMLECPKPLVAEVHGNVVGGGVLLTAACDVVIASDRTTFQLPELRLGLVPTVVLPGLLARLGPSATRSLLMLGERFDASKALALGLIQSFVPAENLSDATARHVDALLKSAPKALATFKKIMVNLHTMEIHQQTLCVRQEASAAPSSEEAKEGLRALLERRAASWVAAASRSKS